MKIFLAAVVRITRNLNTTQVSWTSWMDKWCAVHPYNGILFRIKIIATSFKRFHACAATLNALNPPGCHHRPTPLPVTLGHSQLNLGGSLVASLLLSSGSWCTQGPVCASKNLFPVLFKFWPFYGGVNDNLLQESYSIPESAAPRVSAPRVVSCWTYLHRRHSNTVLCQSLWGLWVLVWTKFVWALWAFLAGMGFDSKCEFAPPTIFLGLLHCPWPWGISLKML